MACKGWRSDCASRFPALSGDSGATYSSDRQPKLVQVQVVHQGARQAEDDERNEELEAPDNHHPYRRLEDVARRLLMDLLHGERDREQCDKSQVLFGKTVPPRLQSQNWEE